MTISAQLIRLLSDIFPCQDVFDQLGVYSEELSYCQFDTQLKFILQILPRIFYSINPLDSILSKERQFFKFQLAIFFILFKIPPLINVHSEPKWSSGSPH